MRHRVVLALLIPLACAGLFARLGAWQLSRLAERRAFNATLAARLQAPPAGIATLPADTGVGHYRRVSAGGVYLYEREVVYAGRTRQGSPGVNLLTPLRIAGRDTVVMVNRGWAYSPDASTIDQPHWREADSASVAGFAETFPGTERSGGSPAAGGSLRARKVHTLDRAAIERAVGLPVSPYVLVQTSDSAVRRDSVPARLTLPVLDEGPHQNYAVQWFSFAAIAIAGGFALFFRSRSLS